MKLRTLLLSASFLALGAAADAATLRWASQADALTLDPHSQNEGPTTAAATQHYDPLIRRTPSLQKEPGLALSWKAIEPTVWEFKLRPNVKFHDGSALTAADVVFSFERARAPSSDFKTYLASVKEVKAVDNSTIHIVTEGPNPILPDQITNIAIMSKAWAEKHNVTKPQNYKDKEETYAVRNAMGTGPFVVKQRDPDIKTVWTKNPAWWGFAENPHNIDEIVYTPVKEPATRVAALLSGQLDFVLDIALQDVGRVKQTAGLKVKETAQIRSIFFGLDMASPELKYSSVKGKNPFADKRVRLAMYKAIDADGIKAKVMRGFSAPAGMVTSPGVHGYTTDIDKRPKHDVEGAKKLMAEAGYANGFDVVLDCPNDRYNNDEAICQAAVAMLAQIGINVKLEARSKTLHFPKLQKKDSSFYLLGWGVPTLDSHYVFSFLAQTNDGKNGTWNFTGYANPKFDALVNGMVAELDQQKRDKLIAEAWQILNGDMIYLPIHHQVIVWAMSDKLDMPIPPNDTPQFRWAKFK
jgi:peptide/nickel transport system substrate-binding protein